MQSAVFARVRELVRCDGLIAVVVAMLLVRSSSAQELRNWSDSTGRYKIQAKLQEVSEGKATLVREDGSTVEIDVKKLSPADQKFIAEQQANPFKPAEANPFKPKAKPAMGPDGASAAGDVAKKVVPDWGSATAVPLTPEHEAWKFAIPILGQAAVEQTRSIATPPKANFFEGARALVVSESGHRLLVGYTFDDPKPLGQTRLVLCDAAKGRMLMTATTPGKLVPMALNDQGTQVLMRRDEWGFGNQDRFEVWGLAPSGITKILECVPYNDVQGGGRDIKWAAFLDEERFATLGGSGKLAVWNASTGQPLYHLAIDGGCQPALTPDRKYLAFGTGKQIGVLDVAAAKVVALQATAHIAWPKLCFSPDGSKLACLAHDKLYVWNFTDGTLYREIPLAGQNIHPGEIIWPRDQYLLIGKTQVFDVENQLRVWSYQGHELVEMAGGQCAFVVSEGHDRPGALVLATVPSPSFDAALAKAMQDPNFLVLKPGVTVKLNVDALPDVAEREKARTTLARKLQERGYQVGPQGTIELIATTETGKEREISYHGFGVNPWRTHKVREHLTYLKFMSQGQVAWQTQGSSVPGVISLKEGETIDQVLRRSEKPNYGFFEYVELPRMLMKPTGGSGLGSSRVTIAGVQ